MTGMLGIEYRPLFAVLVPIIVAFLILVSNKRPNLRESWTLIGSVLLFLVISSMSPIVLTEGPIQWTWFNLLPDIDFAFNVDAFGLIFATTSSCLWILVSLYQADSAATDHEKLSP